MLFFLNSNKKLAYIPAGVFFLIWLVILIITDRNNTLWIQGTLDITIEPLILLISIILAVVAFLITTYEDAGKHQLPIIVTILVIFTFTYLFIVIKSPMTRGYYTEDNHTLLVETERHYDGSLGYYFYQKEGFLSKRIGACGESSRYECEYSIVDDVLIIDNTYLPKNTTKRTEIPLE